MYRKFKNSKYLFSNYNTRREVIWVKRYRRISHLGFLMTFSGGRNHHGGYYRRNCGREQKILCAD